MTDEELLGEWQQGDSKAGEELFARYFDTIYDFFQRKISDDVSDLVQLTFLGCIENAENFRGDSTVRAYLYGIARNQLYRYFRDKHRSPAIDFSVSSLQDLGESPSECFARQGDAALLGKALEMIPLDLQIIVELHYWGEISGPEIAIVLDVPEGTVRSRLRRALEKLRLATEEISSSASVNWQSHDTFVHWAKSTKLYEVPG